MILQGHSPRPTGKSQSSRGLLACGSLRLNDLWPLITEFSELSQGIDGYKEPHEAAISSVFYPSHSAPPPILTVLCSWLPTLCHRFPQPGTLPSRLSQSHPSVKAQNKSTLALAHDCLSSARPRIHPSLNLGGSHLYLLCFLSVRPAPSPTLTQPGAKQGRAAFELYLCHGLNLSKLLSLL